MPNNVHKPSIFRFARGKEAADDQLSAAEGERVTVETPFSFLAKRIIEDTPRTMLLLPCACAIAKGTCGSGVSAREKKRKFYGIKFCQRAHEK